MKWYYKLAGAHVHIRVFNHGMAGELCFRITEFEEITGLDEKKLMDAVTFSRPCGAIKALFINETKPNPHAVQPK